MTDARTLQRQIHAACRQLGLDEETRRELQLEVTGKHSLAAMDPAELKSVIRALEDRGFKPGFKGRGERPRKLAPRGDLRFLHVLWGLLGRARVLDRPDRAGLNAFIRSQFEASWDMVPIDVDALTNPRQIADVISALKDMCKRHGVEIRR